MRFLSNKTASECTFGCDSNHCLGIAIELPADLKHVGLELLVSPVSVLGVLTSWMHGSLKQRLWFSLSLADSLTKCLWLSEAF